MAGFSSLGRLFESFDKNQPQFCVLSPVPASNGLFWHEKAFATLQGICNAAAVSELSHHAMECPQISICSLGTESISVFAGREQTD